MHAISRHLSVALIIFISSIGLAAEALSNGQQVAVATPSAALPESDPSDWSDPLEGGAQAVPVYAAPKLLNSAPQAQEKKAASRTRFVIGVDRHITAEVFALSKPNRVVVELPDVPLNLPDPKRAAGVGLIKSFRVGLAGPRRARLVINVSKPVVVEKTKVEDVGDGSFRLVLEFSAFKGVGSTAATSQRISTGVGTELTGKSAGRIVQPPSPRRAASPKERLARAYKPVIVLDPGHGGQDTGAMKYGTVEKQVVLAFGHELRRQLEASGRYRVLMTRDDDTFVPLDKRVAFGERHDANLFIAIHADYARSSARGATIYTLRNRMARMLKRSAKGSVNRKVLTMAELEDVDSGSKDARVVRDILSDLAERDVEATQNRTGMFAEAVIETMGESTQMRSNPDKQAGFRVLKTAHFPSVLIELAYVSNRQDARNLKSDEWREKVATSIMDAIDGYFSSQVARLPM